MANSAITIGVALGAAQSDQETGTSTTTVVTPGTQQYHPSAAKAWVVFTGVTTTTNQASYNVSSLTDNGTGDTTVNFTTSFSSSNYACVFGAPSFTTGNATELNLMIRSGGKATGSVRCFSASTTSGTVLDNPDQCMACFGDQQLK